MTPLTLREQADHQAKAAHQNELDATRREKPSQFTVGGYLTRDGRVVGGVTYDRKLSNLWGLTAYARAYWNDLPVTTHGKSIEGEAGFELKRKF